MYRTMEEFFWNSEGITISCHSTASNPKRTTVNQDPAICRIVIEVGSQSLATSGGAINSEL